MVRNPKIALVVLELLNTSHADTDTDRSEGRTRGKFKMLQGAVQIVPFFVRTLCEAAKVASFRTRTRNMKEQRLEFRQNPFLS